MAEPYLEKAELDSAYSYLSKAGSLRKYMNSSDVKNYFGNFIKYYNIKGDDMSQENYADSLEIFQNQIIEKAMKANFKVSQTLIETNKNLTVESKKKTLNRTWIAVLVGLLLVLIAFVVLRHKQIKAKFKEFSKRKKEHEFLQTNHEKLQLKFKGLEGFIKEIKKEIKKISLLSDTEIQRQKIKDLYMNIHHNSSTLLSEGDNHFNLVSELNIDFFTKLSSKHPDLNQSELIICYYMFTGFKNREIATFLNSTLRAVESKRYRISKKIGLNSSSLSLLDYLKNNFSLPLNQ
jgi:DNA-binding CsgD family transcriptional regulator